MKKLYCLLCVVLLAACASCAFADSSWKLGGTWNYSIVDKGNAKINGVPAKLTESGTINVRTVTQDSSIESITGYAINCKANISIPSTGFSYDFTNNFNTDIDPVLYIPGKPVRFYFYSTINGYSVRETLEFTQTGVDSIKGTYDIYLSATGETNTFDITATRNSGGDGGGGCNAGFAGLALLLAALTFATRKKEN